MARINLRQGLDRDVYTVLKKLEESAGQTFKSVGQVYDAIKRSNSHLSRQKKRPLEDSIDRVLQFRKEELADSEDSEAAIEEAAEQVPKKTEDERFLLNRQMTKHWHTNTPASGEDQQRTSKKRRIHEEETDGVDGQSAGENVAATSKANGGTKGDGVDKPEKSNSQRKVAKPNRFKVEYPASSVPVQLGGVKEIEQELYRRMRVRLRRGDSWSRLNWRRIPGILLTGAVGVGKRSLVRSLASKLELPLIAISSCLPDPERMEKSVTEAIDEAMRLAPSIIFIEELERYMTKPGSTSHNEHHEKTVDFFERQMQRMHQDLPPDTYVLAIATTSHITDIHPKVIQSGTFEQTLQMRVPDIDAREDIFQVLSKGTHVDETISQHELARLTHGYVGVDIRNIVSLAQERAHLRQMDAEDAAQDNTEMTDEANGAPASTKPYEAATLDDFRHVIKEYVPSLRKEGFTVIPDVSWDHVGAMTEIREQLHTSIIGPIRSPDLYERWGLSRPAGVILWGPPGCGKTLVAQAVANEAQASFILINGPELLNKYVGESERAVRELFQRARSSTPCILFFDEMDSLVPRRDGASSDAGVRVVNALLTELDGVQDRSGIYVIGTTNRPDMIDAAMLRPGRLSVRIFVDLPTEDERVDILRTIYRNLHTRSSEAELARLESVARDPRCRDFSGADLGGLHIKAAEYGLRRWLRKEKSVEEIDSDDWEYALSNTVKSVLRPQEYRQLNSKLGKEA